MAWLGRCRQPGCGGALAAAVGVAFDDELVAGGGEPVDGGLGQQRVGHERQPFAGVAVGRDHGGGFAVAFGDDLVEVGGLGRGEGLERKIVDDEQLDGGQAAVLVVQGVVQAGGGQALEQLVGAGHGHGAAAADGDVAQGGGQVGFPDADGAEDQGAVGAVEEPQGDQLVPELLVVADGGGGVPGFGAHGGVQAGVLGAQGDGSGFAAGDFVGQDELEEVGVGHVLLAGQGEALGQGGGELAELEGAQGGGEVGAERVGQRRHGVVLPVTGGWARAGAAGAAAPALGWG